MGAASAASRHAAQAGRPGSRPHRRRHHRSRAALAPPLGDEIRLPATESASLATGSAPPATRTVPPATGIKDGDHPWRHERRKDKKWGEKRNGSLAAAILAPAVLAACSSDGEGEEGGGAEAFCGSGAEPPMSPQREE